MVISSVLLTETNNAGAAIVLDRARTAVPGMSGEFAGFPSDGKSFEDLLGIAKRRAGGA